VRQVYRDPEDPNHFFSHNLAKALIKRLIAGFRATGLKHGETILVHSFNSIYYPIVILSIIGAGYVFVGTNPSYTQTELNHAIKIAKVKLVLAEPEILPNVESALRSNGVSVGDKLLILNTRKGQIVPQGHRSWRTLCDHGSQDWIRFDDYDRQYNTTACLFFTSGTTGLPKGAMTSHRNLLAQELLWREFTKTDYPVRIVQTFPIFHIGSFVLAVCTQLKDGREMYIVKRFDVEQYLDLHDRHKLTEVFMAPPMVNQIVMSQLADPKSPKCKYSLKSVQAGYVGAAPLSSDMQKRFSDLLADDARYTQVWGMTESTSMITGIPRDVAEKTIRGEVNSWGSVGTTIPELSVKLIDEEGNDVTHTTHKGEACVKGPTVIRGYYENEKANKESFDSEGYYKTGDVLQLDPKTNLFYVVERMKELIKVRGFQVAPAELEGVLTSHSDITDAGVIGVPDDASGELPRAYVVVRQGKKLGEDQIKSYAAEKLAKYKALSGGVVVVDAIPKLPSGKILKRVLREWAKEEMKKDKISAKL
jgi:acyl-CoA synthetase (AMP-forming)/AMP-acid ligase II